MTLQETSREERRAVFRSMIKELRDERASLLRRVADIDNELAEYGFGEKQKATKPSAPKPAGKAPRAGSLKAGILGVISSQPTSTAEIADAVISAGFQTTSKTYRQSVSIALAKLANDGFIRKVKRGTWKAR